MERGQRCRRPAAECRRRLPHADPRTGEPDRRHRRPGRAAADRRLLLSGIGSADQLRDLDIDVKLDLPEVRANLRDHPKSQVSYQAQHPVMPGSYARKPLVLARTDPAGPLDLQMIFVEFALHPRFMPGAENGYSILFSLINPNYLQDPDLKVRGISKLRVADASVMPTLVSGNTNAAVLAIAERAAHLIASVEPAELTGASIA